MICSLDLYQTAGVGVLALALGIVVNDRIPFLKRICIPSPVTGGLLFSLASLLLYHLAGIEFAFEGTLKDICMMVFFTTVGFQSNFSVFKIGGRPLLVMVLLVAVLILVQNLVGTGIAGALGLNPLMGMAAGSITMCGGHGTAAGFSTLMESMGLDNASSIMLATATFGIIAGSLLGGPLGESIIHRGHLSDDNAMAEETEEFNEEARQITTEHTVLGYTRSMYWVLIAIALGTLLNKLMSLTGLTFPTYFGALLMAALIRNITELVPGCRKLPMSEVVSVGNISLGLFLGMAMVSMRLWELSGIALPLLLILTAQVGVIALFGRFVAFPLLGGGYDAAVLVSGLCGFGLGATPNAMANMSAICNKHHYSTQAFVIVPLVGAMFVDIINITIITVFLNFL